MFVTSRSCDMCICATLGAAGGECSVEDDDMGCAIVCTGAIETQSAIGCSGEEGEN